MNRSLKILILFTFSSLTLYSNVNGRLKLFDHTDKTTPTISNSPLAIINLENLIIFSDLSEKEWADNNGYLNNRWPNWEFNNYISERGCLEQSWSSVSLESTSLISVEKCNSWVFVSTFVTGNAESESTKVFTELGKELLPYRHGNEDNMVVYRVVHGVNTYKISVDWKLRVIAIYRVKE